MEVRIRFASECYIKGETLEEIKKKWETLSFGPDVEFIEIEAVEDGETYEDVTDLFNKA